MSKNLKHTSNEVNEVELIVRAQSGDIQARNEIIKRNISLVQKIAAKNIVSSALPNSDLIQEGTLGLITAIEKFNPSLGFKFSTYAGWWVKQAMFKAISEQSYSISIPVYIQETVAHYKKVKQEMEKQEGSEVKKERVAKKLNLTEEKLDTFLNCYNKTLSIEAGIQLSGNKEISLADIIEDEKQNVENEVMDKQLKEDIKLALDCLKEKEKNVIVLRFGLEDNTKKTLEEIGNSYGVTKECIRQIEKKALVKIASNDFAKRNLKCYIR